MKTLDCQDIITIHVYVKAYKKKLIVSHWGPPKGAAPFTSPRPVCPRAGVVGRGLWLSHGQKTRTPYRRKETPLRGPRGPFFRRANPNRYRRRICVR